MGGAREQDLILLREAQRHQPHPGRAGSVSSVPGRRGSGGGVKGVLGWVKRSKVRRARDRSAGSPASCPCTEARPV